MRKILVCVLSRANYGRLRSVIDGIKQHPNLELQLLTGASYYNTLPAHADIQCLCRGDDKESMVITTANLMDKVAHELRRLKPDIVLVHGDRYEVLAAATAAAYMGIPVAHTEGGEHTGCIDDKIRKAISALADIHFPVTKAAKVDLLRQGHALGNVYTVGSPSIDNLVAIKQSEIRSYLEYILVLCHPNTTKDEDYVTLFNALDKVEHLKIVVNPNVDAGSNALLKHIHKRKDAYGDYRFIKDLGPTEYYKTLMDSALCIGNSSSFIKEAAYLGKPAIIVGDRQVGREHADNVVFKPYNEDIIIDAIKLMFDTKPKPSTLFGDGTSGNQIAQILSEVQI